MQLSLWTLFECLKKRGLDLIEDISGGSACIRGIRFCGGGVEEGAKDGTIAFLSDNADRRYQGGVRTVIFCGMDKILIQNIDAITTYNYLSEIIDFYNQWEQQLVRALIEHKSLQDILEIGRLVFERPMFIKSAGSMIFALTQETDNVHANWRRFIEIAKTGTADFESVMEVSVDANFQDTFLKTYPTLINSPAYNNLVLHANIFIERRRIAEIIILENGRPFNKGDPHLLHVFQKVVTEYMRLNQDSYIFSAKEIDCFTDLLDGKPYIYSKFNYVRQKLKWNELDELAVVCVADFAKCVTPILNVLNEQLIKTFNASCFAIYNDMIFGIINITKNEDYNSVLSTLQRCIDKNPFACAVSYEFTEISDILAYYNQCTNILREITQKSDIKLLSAYQTSSLYIKEELEKLPNISCYIHPDLKRLRQFDEEHRSDYRRTLLNFLLFGCNYTDTANFMELHRNTLIYRITRIREIIRSDLDDVEARKNLLFSFLLINI